jgi:hypothetical protein
MKKDRSPSKSGRPAIKYIRGTLKGNLSHKPFDQRWADYKKEEKALEEAKYGRLRPR